MHDIKKDRIFNEWAAGLEKKFIDWAWRKPDNFDDYVMRNNMRSYDRTFKNLIDHCHAPGCGFPLRKDGGQERLPVFGDVCNLCYFMYHVLNAKAYWVGIQNQDAGKPPNNRYDH